MLILARTGANVYTLFHLFVHGYSDTGEIVAQSEITLRRDLQDGGYVVFNNLNTDVSRTFHAPEGMSGKLFLMRVYTQLLKGRVLGEDTFANAIFDELERTSEVQGITKIVIQQVQVEYPGRTP